MAAVWKNQLLFKSSKSAGHNPCKECMKRSAECHAYCKEYNEWRKKHMDDMREIYKDENRERKLIKDEVLRNAGRRKRRDLTR